MLRYFVHPLSAVPCTKSHPRTLAAKLVSLMNKKMWKLCKKWVVQCFVSFSVTDTPSPFALSFVLKFWENYKKGDKNLRNYCNYCFLCSQLPSTLFKFFARIFFLEKEFMRKGALSN